MISFKDGNMSYKGYNMVIEPLIKRYSIQKDDVEIFFGIYDYNLSLDEILVDIVDNEIFATNYYSNEGLQQNIAYYKHYKIKKASLIPEFNIINLYDHTLIHTVKKATSDSLYTTLKDIIIEIETPYFIKPKEEVNRNNTVQSDSVNHPLHYNDGKIEVIDYIIDKKLDFCLGNAIKYISRAGKKDGTKKEEDLKKAIWYLEKEIELDKVDQN